ncbi:MAG: GntR family transcriptional regulator [Phycisphaerae bacterium]|nr:GntR family transcriptional regulator [Phycisphaerae bacterium]
MLITLERNSGVPVFRQICDQVRFQVAAGVLPAGTEIPSTRDLGERLGINPMTVSKAYALLEQEGVLERRPGLSLVVRGGPTGTGNGATRGATAELKRELKHDELARLLRPAANAARQLGVPAKDALEIFRAALRAPDSTMPNDGDRR